MYGIDLSVRELRELLAHFNDNDMVHIETDDSDYGDGGEIWIYEENGQNIPIYSIH